MRVEARHADIERSRWVFPAKESKGKAMPRVVYLSEEATKITEKLIRRYPSGPLFRNSAGAKWTTEAIGCFFDRVQIRMGKLEMKHRGEQVDEIAVATYVESLSPTRRTKGVEVPKSMPELLCESRRKITQRRAREIGVRYSLYGLRHSWATNALQSGIDALTVAVLMGHKDPSTLARTYQHLSHNPKHLLAQMRRVGK